MKITSTILSIPPYISTTWRQISALHVHQAEEANILVIDLTNGNQIEIPHLDDQELADIFHAHSSFLDKEGEKKPTVSGSSPLLSLHLPSQLLGEGLDKISGVLQHNPEAADTEDLPQDFLDKVASISQSFNREDVSNLPTPVEGCNCIFCQIARTIQIQMTPSAETIPTGEQAEEEVSDEDLRFKSWDIQQRDPQLYEVINPLDKNEYYNVFLGNPVGCTCGTPHCEHIQAVLRS